MLWESFKLALRSIRRNVLRSILTLLGVVIGVAAVIALVTIGNGATDKITSDLTKLGSNMLIARPGGQNNGPPGSGDSRGFREQDVDALRRGLRNVKAIAPSASKQANIVFENGSSNTSITGTEADYFIAQDWSFSGGAAFSEADARAGNSVCVVGATIARDVLLGVDPMGQVLRVGAMPCTIVGVMGAKGQSAFGNDQDDTIVMPLRTFQRRIAGSTRIGTIFVSADTPQAVTDVQSAMIEILRETRRVRDGDEDDFTVRDLTQIAATLSGTTVILTGLLGAVAAVSLLVGGIGIMNIMLVSVTERTREIGIRLAIGAQAYQVLLQFLVEAIVLCLIGGLLGIAVGLGLALLASSLLDVPFRPDISVILLAFGFSGLIGLVFGIFPARRAAMLDPIAALRHE
jgi:putative ABC transport system permease protein